MPKFLCVKGILFFSFWQAIGISFLASVGAIKKLGPYTDKEHISLGLTDTLICLEMPFFAVAHLAAFSHRDYIDKKLAYVGRMPVRHAFRDAFGFKDVLEDARATLNGQGMDYREFEPSEGSMHQGLGRERRIRAGLRYSHGGRGKYWLPQPMAPSHWERSLEDGVSAPLLSEDTEDIIQASNVANVEPVAVGFDLPFGDPDPDSEELFASSRKYLFGDYNYPCIDASSEIARVHMWEEEERILNNERSAWFSDHRRRNAIATSSYGAVGVSQLQQSKSHTLSSPLSSGVAIDHLGPAREPEDDHSNAQLRWKNVFRPKFGLKYPSASHKSSPSISTEIDSTGLAARLDAVDLVTEVRVTAEVAAAHDHQQGESCDAMGQTHQSLFENGGREVVAEVRERDRSASPPPAHRDAKGVPNSEVKASIGVTAQVGPPSHAQMSRLVNVFNDLENEENPWV